MSKIDTLLFSIAHAKRKLNPLPKPVVMIPDMVLTDTGEDWPGYETENERARRYTAARHMEVKAYGFDPNQDGVEP